MLKLRLLGSEDAARGLLAEEFPTVEVVEGGAPSDVVIDVDAWLAAPSFAPFDARVHADAEVTVRGADRVAAVAMQVLTRYQRFIGRTNAASGGLAFADVLARHRALHDLSKPLVVADLDHALDAWQWSLRLSPNASAEVQLAALLHDIERLESEPDVRVEQHAPDYQKFKDAHARVGSERAHALVVAGGFPRSTADRVRTLIATHERRGDDPDLALLNDADALSFFCLNSSGYIDYFGVEQTRKKIAYTLGRLGTTARAKLAHARLRPDVDALLREQLS